MLLNSELENPLSHKLDESPNHITCNVRLHTIPFFPPSERGRPGIVTALALLSANHLFFNNSYCWVREKECKPPSIRLFEKEEACSKPPGTRRQKSSYLHAISTCSPRTACPNRARCCWRLKVFRTSIQGETSDGQGDVGNGSEDRGFYIRSK